MRRKKQSVKNKIYGLNKMSVTIGQLRQRIGVVVTNITMDSESFDPVLLFPAGSICISYGTLKKLCNNYLGPNSKLKRKLKALYEKYINLVDALPEEEIERFAKNKLEAINRKYKFG